MKKLFLILTMFISFSISFSDCASKSRKYSAEGEEVKEDMGEEGAEAETGERLEENEENLE